MAKIKVIHDPIGHTLTVWFGDPATERMSVPAGDDTKDDCVLMVDADGKVLGFEIINYRPWGSSMGLDVESMILQYDPTQDKIA
jgi:uncharacterized protein YuzE